jgi:uncharacterized protein YkwD
VKYSIMKSLGTIAAAAGLLLAPALATTLPSYITAASSPAPSDPSFISQCVTKVNTIRAQYLAPALEWSPEIAAVALQKSNGCMLNHTVPPPPFHSRCNQLT